MAERRDPELTPGPDRASEARAAALHQDIRHTRAEMSETLDALGQRLSPDYLKDQAKDAIRSTARDAGTSMLDTIRNNPLPSLIAGLSLGWLLVKGSDADRDRRERDAWDRYREDYYRYYGRYPEPPYGYAGGAGAAGASYGVADAAKARAGEAADAVQHGAADAADAVRERAQDVAEGARHYGRRATNWLEEQMNAHPLGAGAVALAAGVLVGLAVPETEQENELLGRASDRLKSEAGEVAEEKLGQAKRVVEKTAEEAKGHAAEVADAARREAKREGLDEPPRLGGTGKR